MASTLMVLVKVAPPTLAFATQLPVSASGEVAQRKS